ncbi:MAG: DUF1156 domain-containing protein, partial [Armatimonadota bacterium]|nr:DUF1156 domain-containing protein [Armatimonadota bacterium]
VKGATIDSAHEKKVRHGHISTLHTWPARLPLAACRAALIATLLPDPRSSYGRRLLCINIGGVADKKTKQKKLPNGRVESVEVEETVGGILHWGRKPNPELPDIREFSKKIHKAFGRRMPKVLDPFAGGGAIPLEAMRLGCEATAIDINPVAWFILKCTLEYPEKLAYKKLPLPDFVLKDREFMESFFKAQGANRERVKSQLAELGLDGRNKVQSEPLGIERSSLDANLAWQVRAWGQWVLEQARKELARFYPTYAEFEPLKKVGSWEKRPMKLVPLDENGKPDIDSLNAEFDKQYLRDITKPRWIAKPTVAYLWARTVTCKKCRATIPLLKTRWLCKKGGKRVLLTMEPNADGTGVVFGIQNNVPVVGNNAARRRRHDKRIGRGTMRLNGAWCPCCGNPKTVAMTMEDIRLEGQAGRMGAVMTAVVVDPIKPRFKRKSGDESIVGKEYRLPTEEEIRLANEAANEIERVFAEIPFGVPEEPTPTPGLGASSAFSAPLYGFDKWYKLFTPRQLVALGVFAKWTRKVRELLQSNGADAVWGEAVVSYLAAVLDKIADYNSTICVWNPTRELIRHTFARFALPITWDFVELAVTNDVSGAYVSQLDSITPCLEHLLQAGIGASQPLIRNGSAVKLDSEQYDVIITSPPCYDEIPSIKLMDFFYVWLRRTLYGTSQDFDSVFTSELSPKWDHGASDGELVDNPSHLEGDEQKLKAAYEKSIVNSFKACYQALNQDGRLVVIFENKHPDICKTLISTISKVGFVFQRMWPTNNDSESDDLLQALISTTSSPYCWVVFKKTNETTHSSGANVSEIQLTKEPRPSVAKEAKPSEIRERRRPEDRGGGPRLSIQKHKEAPVTEAKKRESKPEIVCWKLGRQWKLAVQVPEEIAGNSNVKVFQKGKELDEFDGENWLLKAVSGKILVQCNKDKKFKIALEKDYLLFKLNKENQGRRIKLPSYGSYLAVVPKDWERDETLSGEPYVAPEPTSLNDYQAHFFHLEKDEDRRIAFSNPRIVIEPLNVELSGNCLKDANAEMGPLFGSDPPKICVKQDSTWKTIKTIVIGEEGRGSNKWRMSFTPTSSGLEQYLPNEVKYRSAGWYFLRFYDLNDELVESMDFRFISPLKEIKIPEQSPFPTEDGHVQLSVEFIHDEDLVLNPADEQTSIKVEEAKGRTILKIPPNLACDESRWFVGRVDGPQVEVVVLAERVWWAISEEGEEPSEWKDRCLELSRDDFAATSKKALWLRFPRCRWVDKIRVGFEQSNARPYKVRVKERTVAIPLRDFYDALPFGNRDFSLKLWVNIGGVTYEGNPCECKARFRCKKCEFSAFTEEDMHDHIQKKHLDEFFIHVPYDELRRRDPSLPKEIYKCSYCGHYVPSSDAGSLTSAIYKHIERECQKAEREMGIVKPRFRVITDSNEIRENVISNLPRLYRCKLCGNNSRNFDEGNRLNHLIKNHKSELY